MQTQGNPQLVPPQQGSLCTPSSSWNHVFYLFISVHNDSWVSYRHHKGSHRSPQELPAKFIWEVQHLDKILTVMKPGRILPPNPWEKGGEKLVLFSIGFIWRQHVSKRVQVWIFAGCISGNCLFGFCSEMWWWPILAAACTRPRPPCRSDPLTAFHLCCSADMSHAHTIQRALESSGVLFLWAVKAPVSEKCIRSEITQI